MVFPLSPESPVAAADTPALLHAVRRALMALSRDGEGKVPRLFSGHEADGAPARSNRHEHVFLAVDDAGNDGLIDRLIVAAPWACDRPMHASHPKRALFDHVVNELRHVRAGRLGVIVLDRPSALPHRDPLAGPAQVWESRTCYRPTRHASRGKDPAAAVVQDAIMECERRGLPRPDVTLLALDSGPNGGNIAARLRLSFAIAIRGPLMLGHDSHMGGGLFTAADGDGHAGR
jgi:CRISPR-associated protein Csb2